MKFKKIIAEAGNIKYWKPTREGEWIQGFVEEFIKDGFGNKQILLRREDENGEAIKTTIPTHEDLKRYYGLIDIEDFIKVTLVEIIPPRVEGYSPQYKYEVEVAVSEDMDD